VRLVSKSPTNPNAARLALTLFVTLVGANDVNVAFTLYDFAVFANLTNASADIHRGGLTFFNSVEFSKRISIWPRPAAPQGLIGVPRRLLFHRLEKRGFN
jgi:hypothetical protein